VPPAVVGDEADRTARAADDASANTAPGRTLRGRLLQLLLWPLLAVLALGTAWDYSQTFERAAANQDRALQRIAIALALRLDVDGDDARDDDIGLHLRNTMTALQQANGGDRLRFLVRGPHGRLIGGDPTLAHAIDPAAVDVPVYADRRDGDEPVRVVTLPHASSVGPITVVVSETTHRRREEARQALLDTLWPNVLMMVLVLVGVRFGVWRALGPVETLSHAVASRRSDDLSPVVADDAPGELRPLVTAMNGLMGNLRSAAAKQQAFLSNAAHQLRTPLAGVRTQVELAQRDASPAMSERLIRIDGALVRMAHSTQQMLALARSDALALQAESMENVPLHDLLEDAASAWLDLALARGIDLGFEGTPCTVRGSRWMLRELLGNLIDNALRHAPRGGTVTVRCGPGAERPPADAARHHGDVTTVVPLPTGHVPGPWLEVQDDGPGLAPEERVRVFERFYRTADAPAGGTGLGLAIVREVALRHGAAVLLCGVAGAGDGHGLRVRLNFAREG